MSDSVQILFGDFKGRPVPRLPRDDDGTPRVADGVKYLSIAQAAAKFRWSANDLDDYWHCTWDDVLLRSYVPALLDSAPTAASEGIRQSRLDMLHAQRFADLSDEQFDYLVTMAAERRLNLWAGHVYAKLQHNEYTGLPEMLVLLTLNGQRYIAQRHPAFAGCEKPVWEPSENEKIPAACTFVVYRFAANNQRIPIPVTVLWDEYAPEPGANAYWDAKPYEALANKAEAKAYRQAFAEELGGLYTPDEVERPVRQRRVPKPAAEPVSDAVGEEVTTRISFEIAAKSMGYVDDKARAHLVATMKAKFVRLYETEESQFWQRAYQELRRNPRAYAMPSMS